MQTHRHSGAQSCPFRGRKGPSYIQGAQALIQPPGSMLSPQAGKRNAFSPHFHDQPTISSRPTHTPTITGLQARLPGAEKGVARQSHPAASCNSNWMRLPALRLAAAIQQQANQHINRLINQHPRATSNAGGSHSTGNETVSTWRKASAATRSLQRGHRRSQCASSCWRCGSGSRAACCNAACTC